jgi:hypothetical protein
MQQTDCVESVLRETFVRITGSGLISSLHSAFEETLFYAFEKESTIHSVGQNGGIERLQQPSWMTGYNQQIRHAFRPCSY